MKRKRAGFLIVALICALLAGCGSGEAEAPRVQQAQTGAEE